MARLLTFAAAFGLVTAWALAGCQALWDLPSQMREPYGMSGPPQPPIPNRPHQNQDKEERLP